MDLGLGRVLALLQRLGSPHTRIPVIHVAGTNGKGSAVACLDALLTHAVGVRSARFVSPHLVCARDSVRVTGGEPVDEGTWELARKRVREADQPTAGAGADAAPIGATPFELLTAQALLAFTLLPAATRPNVLVVEVGVGGRLDATNVFPADQVLASVICPIARDHESLLGRGLAAIAREKAGIVKEHGLCVIADQSTPACIPGAPTPPDPAVLSTLQQVCDAQRAYVSHTTVPWQRMALQPESGRGPPRAQAAFTMPLTGAGGAQVPIEVDATLARISGTATALQTLWSIAHHGAAATAEVQALRTRIRERLFSPQGPCTSRIRAALAHARCEGRSEWHTWPSSRRPLDVLLDGAHNEASAQALRAYLETCCSVRAARSAARPLKVQVRWVIAFSQGRAVRPMLDALLLPGGVQPRGWECAEQTVCFVPFSTPVEGMPWVRPVAPEELAAAARRGAKALDAAHVQVADSLTQALRSIEAGPEKCDDTPLAVTVVCGSLYLVSDFYRALETRVDHAGATGS